MFWDPEYLLTPLLYSEYTYESMMYSTQWPELCAAKWESETWPWTNKHSLVISKAWSKYQSPVRREPEKPCLTFGEIKFKIFQTSSDRHVSGWGWTLQVLPRRLWRLSRNQVDRKAWWKSPPLQELLLKLPIKTPIGLWALKLLSTFSLYCCPSFKPFFA